MVRKIILGFIQFNLYLCPTNTQDSFFNFSYFSFCPYFGRGFYFNLYLLYLKKLFMKKSKGERLNWKKPCDIKINFKELKPNKIEPIRRQAYKYLIP